MSKDPAVLFYTSDFLSGTSFLSYEEKGQYITLLCQQHQSGGIPENHMINICYSIDSPVIKKFIKGEDGLYRNLRMNKEAIKRRSFCDSRSNNKSGRKSSLKNKNHTKITSESYDNHMENENDNGDASKNKKKERTYKPDFEALWNKYPKGKKLGKEEAFGYFNQTVKTKKDYEDINKALDNYKSSKRVLENYAQDGCNWFAIWRDWVNWEESEVKAGIGRGHEEYKDPDWMKT